MAFLSWHRMSEGVNAKNVDDFNEVVVAFLNQVHLGFFFPSQES